MADALPFRTAPVPFPVGTEYYRAPMPPQEFWDRDFAAIRADGLRIVRTFSYWNWVEPSPGRFELDDFDRFFELAARHDLLVWFDLTLATHGACPDWLLREHPDIRQVKPDGTPLHPDSTNAMPQGRMIHCYDHPKWREYGERLLRTVVGRYRDHESLLIWGVWDGASFPTTDGPVCPCYCASTLARYAAWLERRYTLDELNERLHRRYRCWEDVAPARSSRNVVEMLLYRQFHVENLAETLRWQVRVIRELDDSHELRAHGANMPRPFDQACAGEVDSWGMSMPSNELLTGPDPLRIAERCFSFDWSRGIGRGGRWWNEEIYAGMSPAGVTWKPQSHPAEVTSLLWLSLIHGAAGAMFWQYTPEYLSFEAPGYSLTAPDREPTGRLRAVRRALADIDRIAGHVPLQVPQPEVAILYDGPSSEIFLYNGEHQSYLDGLLGLYRTLWTHGIPADVITSGHDWSPYRVVWLPNTALLEAATVDRIAGAVARESGPFVVADGNLGSYAANGRFSYAPPEGLAELLGARVADYDRFTPGRAGSGVLSGAFGHLVIREQTGYAVLEPAGDSRVLARLDGAAVGVERADRRLAWLALSPATAFGGTAPASLVLPLLASRGVCPPVAMAGDRVVPLRRRSRTGRDLLFLFNPSLRHASARVTPSWPITRATDLIAARDGELEVAANGFDLAFGPASVRVVAVDRGHSEAA
ncbi:MAG: beta-galactosidase [Spirochaetaceae bacterium]|nr:beta-galactosidase [Spirochaetaceae bacterium]